LGAKNFYSSGCTLPISLFGTAHTVQNGFDANSKAGQKLLETLERELPLPPEPKKNSAAKVNCRRCEFIIARIVFESLPLEKFSSFDYSQNGFGRAENRFRRKPEEESPNTAGRDAA